MGLFLSAKARNLDVVQAFIGRVAYGFKGQAMQAVNNYLYDKIHGDSADATPAYQYISRESAYGQTFVSDAQRRFVMAGIADGSITPGQVNRDDSVTNAWQQSITQGTQSTIYNTNPASVYVYDNDRQARLNGLVGWLKISDFLIKYVPGAIAFAQQIVSSWVNSGANGSGGDAGTGMGYGL